MKLITNLNNMGLPASVKVLVVFPHPDDETVFTAGLLQKLQKNGNDFRLIVFTSGEASTLTNGLDTRQSLGEVRETELEQAMRTLGVKDFQVADFPDGKLTESHGMYDYLKGVVLDYRPNLIVTYEPSGIYGHPDHIALSRAVTALHTETPSFDILYATVPKTYLHSKNSLKMAENPEQVKPLRPDFVLLLSLSEIQRKYKAMQAHKTQFSFNLKDALRWVWNGLWIMEFYAKS